MGFKCGIVGLPNVGKSTLFNALTNSSKAQAENFPFCTIDPNIGIVPVPDFRMDKLVSISKSKKKINTTISFVDIAGLVKGASKGEGLGNKFLSHIREVDAIIHMIRCFDSDDIQNVNPNVNPVRDLEIIETEMKLADLESIQKRLDKKNKKKSNEIEINILNAALECINNDQDINTLYKKFSKKEIQQIGLLSTKPKLYICNVDEKNILEGNKYTKQFIMRYGEKNTLIISADIENQINQLEDKEKINYMKMINLKENGLNILIRKGYELLEIQTFFTSGPEETRAWTIPKDCTAPKAAGVIHTDFERCFISAQTIHYKKLIEAGSLSNARNKGWIRSEGKEYLVSEGDVMEFLFNV